MKQLFLVLIFACISHLAKAHDFFFAYAEVEINELNQQVETTIYATTHDIERELREETGKELKIFGNENDSSLLLLLENKINEGFQIDFGKGVQHLKIEGIEVKLNGTIFFYLSCPITEPFLEVKITFDLLMKTFQEQQNKLDFKFRENNSTHVFLLQNRTCIIPLSKNDE